MLINKISAYNTYCYKAQQINTPSFKGNADEIEALYREIDKNQQVLDNNKALLERKTEELNEVQKTCDEEINYARTRNKNAKRSCLDLEAAIYDSEPFRKTFFSCHAAANNDYQAVLDEAVLNDIENNDDALKTLAFELYPSSELRDALRYYDNRKSAAPKAVERYKSGYRPTSETFNSKFNEVLCAAKTRKREIEDARESAHIAACRIRRIDSLEAQMARCDIYSGSSDKGYVAGERQRYRELKEERDRLAAMG